MFNQIKLFVFSNIAAISFLVFFFDTSALRAQEDSPSLVTATSITEPGVLFTPKAKTAYRGAVILKQNDEKGDFVELSSLTWNGDHLIAVADDNADTIRTRSNVYRIDVNQEGQHGALRAEVSHIAELEKKSAEAISRNGSGGWTIAFEEVCSGETACFFPYDTSFVSLGEESPEKDTILAMNQQAKAFVGADNSGIEAYAYSKELGLSVICAERINTNANDNCTVLNGREIVSIGIDTPDGMQSVRCDANSGEYDDCFGRPTDADFDTEGNLYVLFRSFNYGGKSPQFGGLAACESRPNGSRSFTGAGIVKVSGLDGDRSEISQQTVIAWNGCATQKLLDNFEGLAVEQRNGRTFLYVISDDNQRRSQRTVLIKFEVTE